MDKTLDLDEMERWAKRPGVWHHQWFTREEILTLIAAARPAVVSDEVVERMCAMLDANFRQTKAGWPEFTDYRASCIAAMRAALALLPGGVPDGYMLVPREPTEAMIRSGQGAADDKYWLWRGLGERPVGSGLDGMALYVDAAYRAMLSASPKGSSRSLPSRTTQEPQSPTPCDLEGEKRLHEMTPEEFAAYSRTLGDA